MTSQHTPQHAVTRRRFVSGVGAGLLASAAGRRAWAQGDPARLYDLIVVGAGTAGLPAAIFAARRGLSVLLVDAGADIGGTLTMAGGEICGAGTLTQARFGVLADHPDMHFDDVMRLSNNLADPTLVRLTVNNAASMIDWLDERGWDCRDGHFITGESPGRGGYSKRRYYQADGQGKAILKVFAEQVAQDIAAGGVALELNTRATQLLTTDSGRVEGIRATAFGEERVFRGRHVLLTTGGYGSNPQLFEELIGQPTFVDDNYPHSMGDGHVMARAVGAQLRNQHLHRPGSGSVLTDDQWPAQVYARFDTRPQRRAPWEIWVNDRGERYVNEETPERSPREQALLQQPRLRYTIIFDDAIRKAAPVGIADWSRRKLASHFNRHRMFHRAATLDELATRAELNPAGLQQTVTEFNARRNGTDPLGRVHRPLPIAKPPFYAIVQHGHSATSATGIAVNEKLQATTANGEPIPGLYAAGEALGSGVYLGNAFVPGMMITPSMTLGKLLGETLPSAT